MPKTTGEGRQRLSPEAEGFRLRRDCRLCGSKELEVVLSLAPTPPANAFVPASALGRPQTRYPLDLALCRACGHLQLPVVLDPKVLFEDYVYVSGTSPVFVRHFEAYAADCLGRFGLRAGDLVVDAGSNDGTLLRPFKAAGLRVLGVDPAREIARRASEAGIETLPEFFTPELARRIRAERGAARLVTANNVFAHADDLAGFAEGAGELLAPDGVFAFEVSYLADVVEKLLFDTIYHEHLAYHAVAPLRGFFERLGLELFDAARVDAHGGSLRGFVQRRGGPRRGTGIEPLLAVEARLKLGAPATYQDFARRIDERKAELASLLQRLKAEGRRVAGFGAPAKATTLLHQFELGGALEFIADDSPWKQGLFSPGHHIPILPASAVYEKRPDLLLILAWNFAEPIMAKHKAFSDQGGRFIVPLPKLEVR